MVVVAMADAMVEVAVALLQHLPRLLLRHLRLLRRPSRTKPHCLPARAYPVSQVGGMVQIPKIGLPARSDLFLFRGLNGLGGPGKARGHYVQPPYGLIR
jgi:hypothetical protein